LYTTRPSSLIFSSSETPELSPVLLFPAIGAGLTSCSSWQTSSASSAGLTYLFRRLIRTLVSSTNCLSQSMTDLHLFTYRRLTFSTDASWVLPLTISHRTLSTFLFFVTYHPSLSLSKSSSRLHLHSVHAFPYQNIFSQQEMPHDFHAMCS
jgi:hypothetical protein